MAGTIAAECAVDVFEPMDQITHEMSRRLSTGCFTKMRATAEGA
jgi:hypothetical protein